MLKRLPFGVLLFTFFFFALTAAHTQDTGNSPARLDEAVKNAALEISKKLDAEKAQKTAVGQFSYRTSVPPLASYWVSQLVQELSASPGRSWTLLGVSQSGADYTVSGEIVEIVNTVRVYTRLFRASDHSLLISAQSDFPRDAFITQLLAGGGPSGGGRSSSPAAGSTPDEFEDDNSFSGAKEIPVGTPQTHTFTNGDDIDWVFFRITQTGRYRIRTRGVNSNRLDTNIELYDANQQLIGKDDDGGENLDSRLSVRLESGTYYLKVECLDSRPDQPYTIIIEAE
jgi:hypothetical protein